MVQFLHKLLSVLSMLLLSSFERIFTSLFSFSGILPLKLLSFPLPSFLGPLNFLEDSRKTAAFSHTS